MYPQFSLEHTATLLKLKYLHGKHNRVGSCPHPVVTTWFAAWCIQVIGFRKDLKESFVSALLLKLVHSDFRTSGISGTSGVRLGLCSIKCVSFYHKKIVQSETSTQQKTHRNQRLQINVIQFIGLGFWTFGNLLWSAKQNQVYPKWRKGNQQFPYFKQNKGDLLIMNKWIVIIIPS